MARWVTKVVTSTQAWIAPPGVTAVHLEMCGGGGGGGGAMSGHNLNLWCAVGGAGGGAGEYVAGIVPVTPGASYTVTIPAVANGGNNTGTQGQDGGTVSFGSLMSALGGGGGIGLTNRRNNDGWYLNGGTSPKVSVAADNWITYYVNPPTEGGGGMGGYAVNTAHQGGHGGGGYRGHSGGAGGAIGLNSGNALGGGSGGGGGAGPWGPGGAGGAGGAASGITGSPGTPGATPLSTSYGAGGGGAGGGGAGGSTGGAGAAGGNGAQGVCIISWLE